VGFTVSKALGKAVDRNKMRRRLREAVRLELWRMSKPMDLVFHPRRSVLTLEFEQLRRDVVKGLAKCGTS
jgi:ribonuclease P protein component